MNLKRLNCIFSAIFTDSENVVLNFTIQGKSDVESKRFRHDLIFIKKIEDCKLKLFAIQEKSKQRSDAWPVKTPLSAN